MICMYTANLILIHANRFFLVGVVISFLFHTANIAHFCLRAHTLRVETVCLQIHKRLCDKGDLHDVEDEKHVLFYALA